MERLVAAIGARQQLDRWLRLVGERIGNAQQVGRPRRDLLLHRGESEELVPHRLVDSPSAVRFERFDGRPGLGFPLPSRPWSKLGRRRGKGFIAGGELFLVGPPVRRIVRGIDRLVDRLPRLGRFQSPGDIAQQSIPLDARRRMELLRYRQVHLVIDALARRRFAVWFSGRLAV